MKDIAALCERVVIIAEGMIIYDGSLSGILDRFSGHKVVTLLFSEDKRPGDLSRYGEVLEVNAPKAKLRVERRDVGRVMASILAQHTLQDITVEDPPLEQVIAEVFSIAGESKEKLETAAAQTDP